MAFPNMDVVGGADLYDGDDGAGQGAFHALTKKLSKFRYYVFRSTFMVFSVRNRANSAIMFCPCAILYY